MGRLKQENKRGLTVLPKRDESVICPLSRKRDRFVPRRWHAVLYATPEASQNKEARSGMTRAPLGSEIAVTTGYLRALAKHLALGNTRRTRESIQGAT